MLLGFVLGIIIIIIISVYVHTPILPTMLDGWLHCILVQLKTASRVKKVFDSVYIIKHTLSDCLVHGVFLTQRNQQPQSPPSWLPYSRWRPKQHLCDPRTSRSSPLCLPGAASVYHLHTRKENKVHYVTLRSSVIRICLNLHTGATFVRSSPKITST